MKRHKYILLLALVALALPLDFAQAKLPAIITREQWGANAAWLFEKPETAGFPDPANGKNGTDAEKDTAQAPQEPDPEIERMVTHDADGKQYAWPLAYARDIKFIVMHYTAVTDNLDDPVADIRNIYHAHAVVKAWGDIGYHYLIDRKGRIYEGRKGGDSVIGGHAKPVNKVSIGIALMGNYEDEELPAPMLKATIELLDELTKKYDVDPLGQAEYKGKTYRNIHGHKDNSAKLDPGRYFDEKFQNIRRLVAYRKSKKPKAKPSQYDFAPVGLAALYPAPQEKETKIRLRIKNKGAAVWDKNTYLENTTAEALPRVFARMAGEKTGPGETGVFEAVFPIKYASGMFMPYVSLVVNGSIRPQKSFPVAIMVQADEKPLRVALSVNKSKPRIMSQTGMTLFEDKRLLARFKPGETATVAWLKSGRYRVRTGKKKLTLNAAPRFKAKGKGILTVANYENRPAWNPSLNDNTFRGVLEVARVDGKMTVINELPLEDYLKGIGEVSNGDPPEKIKTIMILARSYARYYRDRARKFPGKPFDLDDDPDHTQKYLGYGLEARSPNIIRAVKETHGQIVTYQGRPVLTPYFSQSAGRTKSAQEEWGWKDAPWLVSVADPFCATAQFKGHGVGVSGCGATELARQGRTAAQIIQYYYQGVEVESGT